MAGVYKIRFVRMKISRIRISNFKYCNFIFACRRALCRSITIARGRRRVAAKVKERPDSTIFLTKSNITPSERETTDKETTANIKGGINSDNNHLSKRGIERNLEIKKLL